jgi:hypothetical protein
LVPISGPNTSNNNHNLNIEFPEQAAHAQELLNRRSTRRLQSPRSHESNIIHNSKQEPNNVSTLPVFATTLWASFLKELHEKKYHGHTYQGAPWTIPILQQEGYGRAS